MKISKEILASIILLAIGIFGISGGIESGKVGESKKLTAAGEKKEITTAIYDTNFIIGSFGFGYTSDNDLDDPWRWHYHTQFIRDSLKLSHYIFFSDTAIHPPFDGGLEDHIDSYKVDVNIFMSKRRDITNIYGGMFERMTIKTLGYSQRSTYEAEDNQKYGYNMQPGPVTGEYFQNDLYGVTGRCALTGSDSAGYILSGLMENTEQSENYIHCGVAGSDKVLWYIKPRMRIDSNDAKTYINTPVAKIEIYSFDSSKVKEVILTGLNFLDSHYNYNGFYLEEYLWLDEDSTLTIHGDSLNKGDTNVVLDSTYHLKPSKVDYRIWWYGVCNLWVDYMRVDDIYAHQLFHGIRDQKLRQEINAFKENLFIFYHDEIRLNNIPALAYINRIIKQETLNQKSLVCLPFPPLNNCLVSNVQTDSKLYLDSVKPYYHFTDCYPLITKGEGEEYKGYIPPNVNILYGKEYLNYLQGSSEEYTNYIQQRFGDKSKPYDVTRNLFTASYVSFLNKMIHNAKDGQIPYLNAVQVHSFINLTSTGEDAKIAHGINLREPTNEEIGAMTYLQLCYGAKGVLYFSYSGMKLTSESRTPYIQVPYNPMLEPPDLDNYVFLTEGITLVDVTTDDLTAYPIYINSYSQPKFNYIVNLNKTLRNIGPVLMKLDWKDAYSVHTDGGNHEFIKDIISIIPGIPYSTPCNQDNETVDCTNERYIEMGFYDKLPVLTKEEHSKYFMLVNRRTIPVVNGTGGEIRRYYLKLDSNQLSGFRNWMIKDINGDSVLVIFDRNTQSSINIGEFQPGEGKLLKLAPVMQEGGTLVCDENVTASVTCKGEVFAEDKIINIGNQLTISFTSNGGFNFSGGEFHSGNPAQSGTPGPVFTSVSGQKWNGIKLTDGIKSYISKSTFNNIKQDENAIEFYDCADIKVTNSNFTCTQDENSGILMLNFTSNPSVEIRGPYIYQNTFTSNSSIYPAVEIISNASNVTPLLMEENTFTASEGENAVFLSGVTGGAIKCNSISNYSTGIQFLLSNLDIYNNTISSSLDSAKGIYGSGSELTIGGDNYFLGGKNNISLSGNAGTNVKVEDSYFDMDGGKNLFNIKQNSGSYHLFGYFPEDYQGSEVVYCRGNCFKADNTAIDSAIWYITLGPEGDLMTFDFSEMDCNLDFTCNCEDEEVFELGDGINDTVCMAGQGMGGGEKVAVAVAGAVAGEAAGEEVIEYTVYKELKDSINVNTRKRDYTVLENQCRRILLQYPDSSGSREYIMKLYLSVLQQNDTTNQKMSALKSFLEQLITENPNNPKLIIRAFYVIQKCKVSLKEYTSALLGFQYIMNNNPYSIEGLQSSWDYAVVQMLIGSGGAERDEEIKDEPKDSLIFHIVKSEKTEKRKEQSKIKYYRGIESVLQSENSKQEERIRNFEKKNEKVEKPVGNRSIGKEDIEILKKIKEAVKIKKPKSREEHIKIVKTDIRNIFGTKSKQSGTNVKNIIPTEYSLSQNYPNPFNPVTKISFALPKESKVKLIIYDMLGREVARLINNEILSAGTYIREFNGSNLSSGIYFLRILVNEGKDFTDVKKIVLLK